MNVDYSILKVGDHDPFYFHIPIFIIFESALLLDAGRNCDSRDVVYIILYGVKWVIVFYCVLILLNYIIFI